MRSKSFIQQVCLGSVLVCYLIVAILTVACCNQLRVDAAVVYATNSIEEENTFEYSEEFYDRYNANLSKARLYIGDYTKVDVTISTEVTVNKVTRCNSCFRSEGSKWAECYEVIPYGTTVKVVGDSVNGWCPIEYNGVSGWVADSLLD